MKEERNEWKRKDQLFQLGSYWGGLICIQKVPILEKMSHALLELLTNCFCELGAVGKRIPAELQFSYLKIIAYL
jgi:hypothetical protein